MSEPRDNIVRVDFAARRAAKEAAAAEAAAQAEADSGESGSAAHQRGSAAKSGDADERQLAFERMIDSGLVFVTFDTRSPGVQLPDALRARPLLALTFSHAFHLEDFEYDSESVRATLSFDFGDALCVVPWGAVRALSSKVLGETLTFDPPG